MLIEEPYAYYSDHLGTTVSSNDDHWALSEYQSAQHRGPEMVPTGRFIVLLKDKDPAYSGLVALPVDSMETVIRSATVLAVPMVTVKGQRRKGFWAQRSIIKGAKSVDEGKFHTEAQVFWDIELCPGDRIAVMRFGGELLTRSSPRLKAVDYLQLYGIVEE